MKNKILLYIIAAFIVIQLIPYGRDHQNPAVQAEPQWDSTMTRTLFMRACGDCHSHNTAWPWYSSVAPVSWLVQHDVEEGREHFNTSMWGLQKRNKGKDAAEEFEEGDMPLPIYLPMHPEAALNETERMLLLKGLKATFGEKKRDKEKE